MECSDDGLQLIHFNKSKCCKYNFKNVNFCYLKYKERLYDCRSSKVGYWFSIHEHWRHKNNDHNNKITKA